MKSNRWPTFINSAFFVLGFGIIFSLLGVLLQTALSNVADSAMKWFGYAGGLIIIFFGFLLLGLVRVGFLEREHKFQVKRKFRYSYLSSFLFGSAFAVGWTPCVTAALGAILALAVTQSTSAFILLLAYTLGLGVPFLIVGWFTAEAQRAINKAGKYVKYIQIFFGILLILLGILIFTGELSRIANFESAANVLINLNVGTSIGGDIDSLKLIFIGSAFIAGLVSFLSPCILPVIPGFLSYLAYTSTSSSKKENE